MYLKTAILLMLASGTAGCSYTKAQQDQIDQRREYRDHLRAEAERAEAAAAGSQQQQSALQGEHELESKKAQLAELRRRKAEREMNEAEQDHTHSQAMLDARRDKAATQGQVEQDLAAAQATRDGVKSQNEAIERQKKAIDDEIEELLRQETEHAKREEAKRKEQGNN